MTKGESTEGGKISPKIYKTFNVWLSTAGEGEVKEVQ